MRRRRVALAHAGYAARNPYVVGAGVFVAGLAAYGLSLPVGLGLGAGVTAYLAGVATSALGPLVSGVETLAVEGRRVDAAELRRDANALRGRVAGVEGKLGEGPGRAVVDLLDRLDEVLGHRRLDELDALALDGVASIVREYVPVAVETFVNLPAGVRRRSGPGSATEALLGQVGLLAGEADRALDSLVRNDLRALEVQGRFLQSKLGRSDLDL